LPRHVVPLSHSLFPASIHAVHASPSPLGFYHRGFQQIFFPLSWFLLSPFPRRPGAAGYYPSSVPSAAPPPPSHPVWFVPRGCLSFLLSTEICQVPSPPSENLFAETSVGLFYRLHAPLFSSERPHLRHASRQLATVPPVFLRSFFYLLPFSLSRPSCFFVLRAFPLCFRPPSAAWPLCLEFRSLAQFMVPHFFFVHASFFDYPIPCCLPPSQMSLILLPFFSRASGISFSRTPFFSTLFIVS